MGSKWLVIHIHQGKPEMKILGAAPGMSDEDTENILRADYGILRAWRLEEIKHA